MDKNELYRAKFVPDCTEAQCFFYSSPTSNCIFAGRNLGEIFTFAAQKKIDINLLLDNGNCPPKAKKIIGE